MFLIIKVRIWEHSILLRVFKEDAREIWGLLKEKQARATVSLTSL